MANMAQQIEASLNKQVEKRLASDRVITAYRAGANAMLDDAKRTARSGIGTNGSAMPSYSERYRIQKAHWISTGKFGKKSLKRYPNAARSVNDKTVLTGNLHNKMQITNVRAKQDAQGFLSGSFTIGFKDRKTAEQFKGLMEKGYTIGLARKGTAAGRRQAKLFTQELQRALGFRGGAASLGEA